MFKGKNSTFYIDTKYRWLYVNNSMYLYPALQHK